LGLVMTRRFRAEYVAALVVASVSVFVLQGCLPWRYSYDRIQAPQAVHYRNWCRGSAGPPYVVYYPFHGIFISLAEGSTMMGLHVPEGVTAQLNGDAVVISGLTKTGPIEAILHIEGFSRHSLGNIPPDSRAFAEQFRLPAHFGTLPGATRGGHFAWCAFHADHPEEQTQRLWSMFNSGELIRGTIKLPPLTIGGVRYEEQILSFEHAGYFDFFNPVSGAGHRAVTCSSGHGAARTVVHGRLLAISGFLGETRRED
jgi:hypothetical protein